MKLPALLALTSMALAPTAIAQVIPPIHGPGFALAFGGAGQHANTLANPIAIGPAITIEAWINAGGFNYGEVYALCDDPNSACTGVDYKVVDLRVNPSGQIEIGLSPTSWSSRRIYLVSTVSISLNTWTHVAGSMDLGSNTGAIYINGIAVPFNTFNIGSGTGNFTGSPAIGALQVSGATTGVQYPFTGQIDELRVWSTVVSQSSIRDFMCRNDLTGHPDLAGLQALYHVEEPGPNTATVWDHIGNHHATLTNVSVANAYVQSAAALGDVSAHVYGGANVSLVTPFESFLLSSSSNSGKHIYHVDPPGAGVDGSMPGGLDAAGGGCFGVFLAETAPVDYLVNYNYTGNPELDGTPSEPTAVLLHRDGPLGVAWTQHAPQYLSQPLNVIDLQGTWQRHLQWAGAYTPVLCTNDLVLELVTDGNATQTSWEILPSGGGAPLCSGTGYVNHTTYTLACCLSDGCYDLNVYDSFGDGIASPGGYVLRDENGDRIIDNAGDGDFSFTSSATLPFCVPISGDQLTVASCDKQTWLTGEYIVAGPNAAVSAQWGVGDQSDDGYQFWFFDPDGGYARRIFHGHATSMGFGPPSATRACHVPLSFTPSPLPANKLLNVRVRSRVNGIYGEFGPACRFKLLSAPPACPTTQLDNNPLHAGTTLSCGATGKVVGASGNAGKLWALPVAGATHYKFRFELAAEGFLRTIASSAYHLMLGAWVTGPLLCGSYTYDVSVAVSTDGGTSYCPFGPACTVEITNGPPTPCTAPFQGGNVALHSAGTTDGGLLIWPVPNDGRRMMITASDLDGSLTIARLSIHDAAGALVAMHEVPVGGGSLNTALTMAAPLAPGLYVLSLQAGELIQAKRLVVQ